MCNVEANCDLVITQKILQRKFVKKKGRLVKSLVLSGLTDSCCPLDMSQHSEH